MNDPDDDLDFSMDGEVTPEAREQFRIANGLEKPVDPEWLYYAENESEARRKGEEDQHSYGLAQLWACTVCACTVMQACSFEIRNAYNAQRNNMSRKSNSDTSKETDDMVKKLDRAILTEVKEYEKRDKIKYIKNTKTT